MDQNSKTPGAQGISAGHATPPPQTPIHPRLPWAQEQHVQFVEEISLGRTNPEIAQKHGLKPDTVKRTVEKIKFGLSADNRQHIPRRAYEEGLLKLPEDEQRPR